MNKPVLLSFFIAPIFVLAQDSVGFKPTHSTFANTSIGTKILQQCSRAIPKKVAGFWIVGETEKQLLENNFKKVLSIQAMTGGIIGASVKRLDYYAFQYLGVIINGKKYVYINAFSKSILEAYKNSKINWKTTAINVCDGGEGFWGALFDLEKLIFSDLAFNGEG